jgi:hypothetical protein
VLLWSGLSQFVDAIPQPFQQASQERNVEWAADDQDAAAEMFETAPLPTSLGEGYPVYDHWIRSEIRVIVYQDSTGAEKSIEVSQYIVEGDSDPPSYMTGTDAIDDTEIFVDDPDQIQEARWLVGEFVHHLQFHAADDSEQQFLTLHDLEAIVEAFLEEWQRLQPVLEALATARGADRLIRQNRDFRAGPFTAGRFVLFNSVLQPDGAVHVPEGRRPYLGVRARLTPGAARVAGPQRVDSVGPGAPESHGREAACKMCAVA